MLIDIKVKNKIIDCITFFNENLQFELRFNILKNFVSNFLICESIYDHRGNKKPITFLKNRYKNQQLEASITWRSWEWDNVTNVLHSGNISH